MGASVFLGSLIGSSLSTVASSLLILCYFVFPSCRTYRHRLILSLSLADFLNALNNTISGTKLTVEGALHKGLFCSLNGFVGQLTVQAQDFSTLLIAITTFVALSYPLQWLHGLSFLQIHESWLYLCIWGIASTTSLIGLFAIGYVPVSGNWCWLPQEPPWIRYALTHGFRFVIIPTVILIYVRLLIVLKRSEPNESFSSQAEIAASELAIEASLQDVMSVAEPDSTSPTAHSSQRKLSTFLIKIGLKRSSPAPGKTDAVPVIRRTPSNDRRVTKTMLKMCLYPAMYTICWLPGILNRLLEMGGGHNKVLTILQAATQFIGFFDALLYGLTENLRHEIQQKCRQRTK